LSKKWDDAKAYCEGNGDRLAVFDSTDSICWAKHMRKTHSGKFLYGAFLKIYCGLECTINWNSYILCFVKEALV